MTAPAPARRPRGASPGDAGTPIAVDGRSLTWQQVDAVARHGRRVRISAAGLAALRRARRAVERVRDGGEAVYGVNTGFGALATTRVPDADMASLQVNLVRSHASGTGEPLPVETVRAALLVRLNTLCRGVSGCRPVVAEALAACLNSGLTPHVPRHGSLGASGDLAPTAHAVLALMGEGSFLPEGRPEPAAKLLRSAGLSLLQLEAKDGLSLLNGTPFMAGAGALLVADGWHLLDAADAIGALSVEVLLGSVRPFDSRVHEVRPHRGQGESAAAVRALLQRSPMVASHANCGRVQDAYSLRCLPQVHGAARDVVRQTEQVIGIELNAGVDNPLILAGGPEGDELISAGNFHGAPLGMALDSYKVALAAVGAMSERRTNRLLNPHLSELPAFLTERPGLNSGFMILQYTAAALVSENKSTAHPASVDSIPTSADQEDHVSMGWTAALQGREIADRVARVLAVEALCAAQAADLRLPLRCAVGSQRVRDLVRSVSARLEDDRSMSADIEGVSALVLEGRFAELRSRALAEHP